LAIYFLFIILLGYILRQTESGNYGVQTHLDKILRNLDFADDIVLLDENSESATGHIICLKEIASKMGLYINFKKTKTYFINCDTSIGQQQIEPVTDFRYLGNGSMIASPVEDLKRRRGLAWAV